MKTGTHDFWIAVGVAFVLSFLTIISAADTLTGHASIQTVGYAQPGSKLFFEVKNIEHVQAVQVVFGDTVKNGKITFTQTNQILMPGTTMSSFSVQSMADLTSLQLNLKVPLKTLGALEPEELAVYKQGYLQPTQLTKISGEYAYYTADASGVGDFIIGKASKETVNTPPPSLPKIQAIEPPAFTAPLPPKEVANVRVQEPISTWKKIALFFTSLF